jgi:hypothetical protein
MSPIGGQVQIDNLQSFMWKQETTNIKRTRMDGVQLLAELPTGWSGSIEFDRATNGVEALFAAMQQAWIAGGSYKVTTLYCYITEANGSQTTLQFDNVPLKLSDGGTYKGDAVVTMKIEFMANSMALV